MTVYLKDLMNIEDLKQAIKDKDVVIRDWEKDSNYKILCYSKTAQIFRRWNSVTLNARGVIVDTTASNGELNDKTTVTARSFKKFFAINAVSNGKLSKIDDDEDVVVAENVSFDKNTKVDVFDKVDGTMGVCFIGPDGLVHIATKGSMDSDFAKHGDSILHKKHNVEEFSRYVKNNLHDENLIFEIISPVFGHVINYGDLDDLILLGKIRIKDGWWTPLDKNSEIARKFGFLTTDRYPEKTLGEAVEQPDINNHEGVVVTTYKDDGTQELYKIKYSSYLKLRMEIGRYREKPSIYRSTIKDIKHLLRPKDSFNKWTMYLSTDVDTALEYGIYTEDRLLKDFNLYVDDAFVKSDRLSRLKDILNNAYKTILDEISVWNDSWHDGMNRADIYNLLRAEHLIAFTYGTAILNGKGEDEAKVAAFRRWLDEEYARANEEFKKSRQGLD